MSAFIGCYIFYIFFIGVNKFYMLEIRWIFLFIFVNIYQGIERRDKKWEVYDISKIGFRRRDDLKNKEFCIKLK